MEEEDHPLPNNPHIGAGDEAMPEFIIGDAAQVADLPHWSDWDDVTFIEYTKAIEKPLPERDVHASSCALNRTRTRALYVAEKLNSVLYLTRLFRIERLLNREGFHTSFLHLVLAIVEDRNRWTFHTVVQVYGAKCTVTSYHTHHPITKRFHRGRLKITTNLASALTHHLAPVNSR